MKVCAECGYHNHTKAKVCSINSLHQMVKKEKKAEPIEIDTTDEIDAETV